MAEKFDTKKPEVEFADGAIIIRVPARTLRVAAKYAWDQHFGSHRLYVSDEDEFAKEVLSKLRREDEAGNNMIHRMLDAAMIDVAEDGGEGVGERA